MGKEQGNMKMVTTADMAVAHYPYPLEFRDRRGHVVCLPPTNSRHGIDKNAVTPNHFITLPYFHPERPEDQVSPEITAKLAQSELDAMKEGTLKRHPIALEVEGNLYKRRHWWSRKYDLIPKYDGKHFTAENDLHPESIDSMIEVATDKLPDGRYPSSPLEFVYCLTRALQEGIATARKRGGIFVIASVPEGGNNSQVRRTPHPYIENAHDNNEKKPLEKREIPPETRAICKAVGLNELFPKNATHTHTSVPKIPETTFFDPRIAHAKAQLRLTRFAKMLDFPLFNTKDYLGVRFPDTQDIRSYMRRTYPGAQDGLIKKTAYKHFKGAIQSVFKGTIPFFSREPGSGQHDRVRIKEIETVENVTSPAHPDVRFLLMSALKEPLLDVFSLEALVATEGDESQVLPYLQYKYGALFEELPTMEKENSCYEHDKAFNKAKFKGEVDGVTFEEYLKQGKTLFQKIGEEYPGLQLHATIVNHVLTKVLEEPTEEATISRYMDLNAEMCGGIFTDYLSKDINQNIRDRAEGTEKQVEVLNAVKTEEDLVKLFGIPYHQTVFDRSKLEPVP